MKSILSLIFLLAAPNCFSQKLVDYQVIPCNEPLGNTVVFNQGIFSEFLRNDTLNLKIGLILNCASELNPSFTLRDDSLILILKDTAQIHVSCVCYFRINFIVSAINHPFTKVIIDNYELKPIHSKYTDFPPNEPIQKKLIKNKTDDSGNKIGYWYKKGTAGFYYIVYYGDGNFFENSPLWLKCFSKKNELIYIDIYNNGKEGGTFYKKQYDNILKEISEEQL